MKSQTVTYLHKTCWLDSKKDHQPRIDCQGQDSYKLQKINKDFISRKNKGYLVDN